MMRARRSLREGPQIDVFRWEHFGKEDCMYLSVYKPEHCTRDNPCPVMHWIYGGGWKIGGNDQVGGTLHS